MTQLEHYKIDVAKIRSLTEVDNGYKLVNMALLACYNGLHPDSLSKLCNVLFNVVLHNKMYHKSDKKYDNNKRIFSSTLMQPFNIAHNTHPVKYSNGETADNDISNIIKRLDELEANNIFYIWKYKQPFTYIYIMERYIDSWKYYNPKGFLTIQSFRKIASLSKDMINTMITLEGQRDRIPDREDIEKSYGYFLNSLIEKMNPSLSKELTRFTEDINIFSYIAKLIGELKKLEKLENVEIDDSFLKRLPVSVRNRIMKSCKGGTMNLEMAELIPQNPNITNKRKKKDANREIAIGIMKKEVLPEVETYGTENKDPFEDPSAFVKFYRASIKMYNNAAKFYDFALEVRYAAEIMDLLLLNGRNNKKFLQAWIRSYLTFALVGNNIYKEEKTSLKTFKESFDKYNNTYIG